MLKGRPAENPPGAPPIFGTRNGMLLEAMILGAEDADAR
jgi:hypothetical protein